MSLHEKKKKKKVMKILKGLFMKIQVLMSLKISWAVRFL